MKRITKENLATAFQILVIIFLFSYSTPSLQKGNNLNTVDSSGVVVVDSMYASEQIRTRPVGNNVILDYHKAKKIYGLFNTQLTMVFNVKVPSNPIVPNEKNTPGENWLSSSRHPVFLSIK